MSQTLLKKCLASTVRSPLRVLGSVAPPRHHVVEAPPFASATHPANRSRGTFCILIILEDGRWQLRFHCNLSASVGKSLTMYSTKTPLNFPKQTVGRFNGCLEAKWELEVWMIASFQFLATCIHLILPKTRKTAWTISTLSHRFSWHLQVTKLRLEMHRDIAVALLGAFVLAVGLGQALLQSSDLRSRSRGGRGRFFVTFFFQKILRCKKHVCHILYCIIIAP